jgi:hypothetical protein
MGPKIAKGSLHFKADKPERFKIALIPFPGRYLDWLSADPRLLVKLLKKSKEVIVNALLGLTMLAGVNLLQAQGTAFTYQGRLSVNGAAANGLYDLQFTLYDALTGGGVRGGPVTNLSTRVTDGWFTTTLDFGSGVFAGGGRWLQLAVRTNGGPNFVMLSPRQPVTPTPYAIHAVSASNATSATAFSGTVADNQLSTNIARLNGSVAFSGTVTASGFRGDGANMTNVNATTLGGLTSTDFTSLPPPGWIWRNQPTPMWCVSTFIRWGANAPWATNANEDWVTNVAYSMFTNGMVAAGCDIIKFEDVNSAFIRDAQGGLVPNPARFPNGFSNMLSFCHKLGVRVLSYVQASRTSDESIGAQTCGGNPYTPLCKMYRDVLTNYVLGFDGLVIDFDVNDIDVETIRIGNRLANQAVFDADAQMIDGSKTNRANFVLERAMAPGSTPNTPGHLLFPYESIYELNVVGAPGLYQNYDIFSELLTEARMIMSYRWFVRPGVTPTGGGWDSACRSYEVNRNILSIFAMVCATLNMNSGFGEHPASGLWGPIPSVELFTNRVFSSIFKDPGVIPGHVAWSNALQEVWIRPLGFEGSRTNAVLLINSETNVSHIICVTARMLGVPDNMLMNVQDVFGSAGISNFTGAFSLTIPGTNMILLKTFPAATPFAGEFVGNMVVSSSSVPPAGTNYGAGAWVLWSYTNSNSNTLYASLRDCSTSNWLTNAVLARYVNPVLPPTPSVSPNTERSSAIFFENANRPPRVEEIFSNPDSAPSRGRFQLLPEITTTHEAVAPGNILSLQTSVSSNGEVDILISEARGKVCHLLSSHNLLSWDTVATNRIDLSGRTRFRHNGNAACPRFYKVVLQ